MSLKVCISLILCLLIKCSLKLGIIEENPLIQKANKLLSCLFLNFFVYEIKLHNFLFPFPPFTPFNIPQSPFPLKFMASIYFMYIHMYSHILWAIVSNDLIKYRDKKQLGECLSYYSISAETPWPKQLLWKKNV